MLLSTRQRDMLYTPVVVIWAWLSQVIDADKSLSNAIKQVMAWMAAAGEVVPSAETGGYSKARKRLPLSVLKPLLKRTAAALTAEVKPEHRWCGRRVKAYDGTSVLMSDTPANQKAYLQLRSNQKAGCGLPLANAKSHELQHHNITNFGFLSTFGDLGRIIEDSRVDSHSCQSRGTHTASTSQSNRSESSKLESQ